MTHRGACASCLARAWLLERLAGHLEVKRGSTAMLLALDDESLVEALAGQEARSVRHAFAAFDADAARRRHAASRVATLCRCDPDYPPALGALPTPPAVLHFALPAPESAALDRAALDPAALDGTAALDAAVAARRWLGALGVAPVAAIVGARRASPYALEAARSLARGVSEAGVTVVSGMAQGVDAAAHEGALGARASTVAVLACAPERAYPRTVRGLHRRLVAEGLVISELGPGVRPRRWMFPARNRIIAALAGITVVVAAARGSGALLTAACARELGRRLGAVPGPIFAPLAFGPHQLLRDGARLVTEHGDILAALGVPADSAERSAAKRAGVQARAGLPIALRRLLEELANGNPPVAAFAAAGFGTADGLAALAELELAGRVRRGPGGSVTVAG